MLSVVIPTLQRRVDVLEKLVKTLSEDSVVGEIIVIDNSTKGVNFSYDKLRVLVQKENLFVNPAWNLGVEEAKYEYVALLNDDIIISPKTCAKFVDQLEKNKNLGAIAFHVDSIIAIEDICEVPEEKDFELERADFVAGGYGMATFFRKELYKPIPNELKIWFGDNFIFRQVQKSGYDNYWVHGQKVYHFGSLTSSSKEFNPIYINDKKVWNKTRYKWYNYLLYLEEYSDCIKLRILGANIRIFNKRNDKKLLKF